MTEELLTVADIVAMANRSTSTIHRWIDAGLIVPAFRLKRTNQALFIARQVEAKLPELLAIQEDRRSPSRRLH